MIEITDLCPVSCVQSDLVTSGASLAIIATCISCPIQPYVAHELSTMKKLMLRCQALIAANPYRFTYK
jgi:hypothetical protein